MKNFIYLFIICAFLSADFAFAAPAADNSAKAPQVSAPAAPDVKKPAPLLVSPLFIVNNPGAYLNKTVSFSGEFAAFTSLGLDYKPAFKDSSKYIGILIKRPDVKDHTIPLSEMKLFMNRKTAEKNMEIEPGDKFKLTAKVFSAALGDPWLEVIDFQIIDKKNKDNKDNTEIKQQQ